jgi:hypothetical protein
MCHFFLILSLVVAFAISAKAGEEVSALKPVNVCEGPVSYGGLDYWLKLVVQLDLFEKDYIVAWRSNIPGKGNDSLKYGFPYRYVDPTGNGFSSDDYADLSNASVGFQLKIFKYARDPLNRNGYYSQLHFNGIESGSSFACRDADKGVPDKYAP